MFNLVKALDKVGLKTRFVILMVSVFVLLVPTFSGFIKEKIADYRYTKSEIDSLTFYMPLVNLNNLIYQLNIEIDLLKNNESDHSVDTLVKSIDEKLLELNNMPVKWHATKFVADLKKVTNKWSELRVLLNNRASDANEKLLTFTDEASNLIVTLADGTLSLDPEAYSFILQDVLTTKFPEFMRHTSVIGNLSIDAFHKHTLSPENRDKVIVNLALLMDDFDKTISSMDSYINDAPSKDIKKDLEASVINTFVLTEIVNSTNFNSSPKVVSERFAKFMTSTNTAISRLHDLLLNHLEARLSSIETALLAIVVSTLFLLLISIAFIISFYLNTKNVINEIIYNAGQIEKGDLTKSINLTRKDDFSIVMLSINNMRNKLLEIVAGIHNTSVTVSRGATEISEGNLNLSQRTEEQASSLASTAASMEELSVTVKENADQSQRASLLADQARQLADSGGAVVNDAVASMSQINNSSKKIAEISSVIDSIAFQTNLLALNAAVEAARAGEQGRGFAVVAAEVRNLSHRSSIAAKEINTLINESVEKIGQGTELVNKSGEALQQIVNSIRQVSDSVKSIASSTVEQSAGLQEINNAITKMDGITQQNAALVEETAAASENVSKQTQELIKMIEFFKVDAEANQAHSLKNTVGKDPITYPHSTQPQGVKLKNDDVVRYVPKESRASISDDSDWKEF